MTGPFCETVALKGRAREVTRDCVDIVRLGAVCLFETLFFGGRSTDFAILHSTAPRGLRLRGVGNDRARFLDMLLSEFSFSRGLSTVVICDE